jgi:hypothetical protein
MLFWRKPYPAPGGCNFFSEVKGQKAACDELPSAGSGPELIDGSRVDNKEYFRFSIYIIP